MMKKRRIPIGYGRYSLRELTQYMSGIKNFKYLDGGPREDCFVDFAECWIESTVSTGTEVKERFLKAFDSGLVPKLVKSRELPDDTVHFDFRDTLWISILNFRDDHQCSIRTTPISAPYGRWELRHFDCLRELEALVETFPERRLGKDEVGRLQKAFVPLEE